jgi:hypothetical protein
MKNGCPILPLTVFENLLICGKLLSIDKLYKNIIILEDSRVVIMSVSGWEGEGSGRC